MDKDRFQYPQIAFQEGYKQALEDEIKFLESHIINLENFVEDYWHDEHTDYRAMLVQMINELKGRLETLKEKTNV